MPSLLPQYRPADELPEDQQPLTTWKDNDRASPPPPSYPPTRASGSGTTGINVTFTFSPRWPTNGTEESVLGKVGGKDDTIAMVRRAFSHLADYPPERIEFLSPVVPDAKIIDDKSWSRILDEAWDGFESNPPGRLRVQIADAPGDAEKRKQREKRNHNIGAAIFFGAPLTGVLIIVILAIMGKLGSGRPHNKT